ncbi:hypothetical protein [Clostridium sp. YIM B02506]|uniref:hypothetical protein n=1 Tax=Clostridium sp. YIM B02506 TaxID=2910680 RepID=UPI001EED7346|nr:hypothetical protein [Clostridium sp. YIM B02506]
MNSKGFVFKSDIPQEWKEIFKNEGKSDCLSYLESAINRIIYAIHDLFAYDYAKDEWGKRQLKMGEILREKGSVSDKFFLESRILYCGYEMPYNSFLAKINFTFFSSLHSFFDIYGKFLLNIFELDIRNDNIYLIDVVREMEKCSKYKNIAKKIRDYTRKNEYKYIYDLNNSNKHNKDVSVKSILFIDDGTIDAEIESFKQKKKTHPTENMVLKLEDITAFVIDFYDKVTEEVVRTLKMKS